MNRRLPEAAGSRLMRFPQAVRRDPAVTAWLRGHPGPLGVLARRWFAVMRGCGTDVRELLHDGHPTACVGDAAFGYVNVFRAHVNVGFFRGAELADPERLLEGTGKLMRHVKLVPGRAVDAAALQQLVEAAYAGMKRCRDSESSVPARKPGARGKARPATIAEYIQAAPREGQPHLRRLYALLKRIAPGAEETIKWGSPFFVEPRFLFAFSGHQAHVDFTISAAGWKTFRDELAAHRTTRNFLQVPYHQPLPEDLIRRIAKARLREVRARQDDAFW